MIGLQLITIIFVHYSEIPYKSTEAWIARQKLQDLYQSLLLLDLEYALDKKVEQDL